MQLTTADKLGQLPLHLAARENNLEASSGWHTRARTGVQHSRQKRGWMGVSGHQVAQVCIGLPSMAVVQVQVQHLDASQSTAGQARASSSSLGRGRLHCCFWC